MTLFHQLPGAEAAAIRAAIATHCVRQAPAPFTTAGLRRLGRGTAYLLHMPAIGRLRSELAAGWEPWLTAQDRQRWQPHITVQNKASAEEARQTHQALLAGFAPQAGLVIGVSLWRYLGGPWSLLEHQPFSNPIA